MNVVGNFSNRFKIAATTAAVVLALALGVLDYVTGREWAISALYLLPTVLAAWVAGRWMGWAVGAICTAAWFVSDNLNGANYEQPLIPFWNAAMLFAFFAVVVGLVNAVRVSHDRLERTVARRTAALQAEIEERKRLEDLRRTLGVHIGKKVAEEILARDPGLGGMEQDVSVMFVDIRCFTARTAKLKPDEAVHLLNRFSHAMVDVVEGEHDGMINKFLGDGFMAVFGVGGDGRNHADKAVAAGRDLQHRLERLNRDLARRREEPIQIGVGINSGRAIVGSIGSPDRMEFTVIGNTVNVASRIERLNKILGTTFLISRATRDALRRPISLRALPRQAVEGVPQPIEIYAPNFAWT